MRPLVRKESLIKRAKYRFHWFKEARKLLRNKGRAPTDQAIAMM